MRDTEVTKQWSFVGPGHGAFEPQLSYQYVGDGNGSFHKGDMATHTGWRLRPWCRVILLLLVLAGIFLIFWLLWPREEDLVSPTSAPSYSYDCEDGESDWRNGWSGPKKKWCCLHFERGCEQDVLTFTTSRPAPEEFHLAPTGSGLCDYGISVPAPDCQSAAMAVLGTQDLAVQSSTESPPGCSVRSGARWTVHYNPSGTSAQPGDVYQLVCTGAQVGSSDGASGGPPKDIAFDCTAAVENWQHEWSPMKQKYCCKAAGMGCTYDCSRNTDNWQESWSMDQQIFCCKSGPIGCLFDCAAAADSWEVEWSAPKQAWCCRFNGDNGIGCLARGMMGAQTPIPWTRM